MPARLRPTAKCAADAILVGDPGRALALAQVLLTKPLMSNHARGLWGYTGTTASGAPLSIQATGIGGPSAALVLSDLAELGVRRAVRVGTAIAIGRDLDAGAVLVVETARIWRRSLADGEPEVGPPERPEPELAAALAAAVGPNGRHGELASLEILLEPGATPAPEADAADMQTAAILAAGRRLGVGLAALTVIESAADGSRMGDDGMAAAVETAGLSARDALAT